MAETIGYAKIELELDDKRLNAGLAGASSKLVAMRKTVASIDFKKLGSQADALSTGLSKVLSASRAITAVLAAGSIAAALKNGGEEGKRLQSRLDSVKGAFAGLGERLLKERIFGRTASDWAQRVADGLNSIDTAKLSKLIELIIGMQALKTGADVFGGLSKIAGLGQGMSGLGSLAGGGQPSGGVPTAPPVATKAATDATKATTEAGKAASKASSGLGQLALAAGKMVLILAAMYVVSKLYTMAVKKWDIDGTQALGKSREGLRYVYDNLAKKLKAVEAKVGIDTTLTNAMSAAAERTKLDRRFGRVASADDITKQAKEATPSVPALEAMKKSEEARLKVATEAMEKAQTNLRDANSIEDNGAGIDYAEAQVTKQQGILEGVTESVTRNLATLDEALRNTEQFKDGLRSAAEALFNHAEDVRTAQERHAEAMYNAGKTYKEAMLKASAPGTSITAASESWGERFQQSLEDATGRAADRAKAEREMQESSKEAAESLSEIENSLIKANERADRMEQFFKEKLGSAGF